MGKHSAGRVEAGDAGCNLDDRHDGVHAKRSLHLLLGLGAVEDDGDARGALGDGGGRRALGGDERDGVVNRRRRERSRVGDDADANLLEAADGAHRLLVIGRGDLGEEDGIRRGDVAEGHAHRELGAQVPVERILRREHRGGHRGEHGTVAVEDVTQVDGVVLLLRREFALAAREILEIAPLLLKLLHAELLRRRLGAQVAESRARLHLEVRRLGE